MMRDMRTTLTIETDVERMLREEMHRTRRTFKETLNAVLRSGLAGKSARPSAVRFVVKARPMGMRAGLDPAGFNKLADELEADAFLAKSKRARK